MPEPRSKDPRQTPGDGPVQRPPSGGTGFRLMPLFWLLLIVGSFFALRAATESPAAATVPYSAFKRDLAAGRFRKVILSPEWVRGVLAEGHPGAKSMAGAKSGEGAEAKSGEPLGARPGETPPAAEHPATPRVVRAARPPEDKDLLHLLDEQGVEYEYHPDSGFGELLWAWLLPLALILLFWGWMMRRVGGMGAGLAAFGKSKARVHRENDTGVTFADVAGIDEAVEELKEIVDFLKSPEKYRRLGGRIPKGVLLVGPPGTGKTLLARAVAGEAGVPFFSLSGSEFVEMFVGVGAARVRDLFEQAAASAPAIIFIDELDAIGKSRAISGPVAGGNDEREQTLNQLLAEMDGFDPRVGLIVLAATNRPNVLDPALLRPGRFDRQVLVDKPDKEGRKKILEIHLRGVKVAPDVSTEEIAARTPGFAGADLANVVNEAALLAARRGAEAVEMQDFEHAIERVVAGLKRKNRRMSPEEKRIVAYHEAGHALVGQSLPFADPVQKVSIIPHGLGALGFTLQMPLEDRYLLRREELEDKIAGLLGGRAAEELVFGTVSTGAADDLQKATHLARSMVTEYGMSEALGPLYLRGSAGPGFLGEEDTTPLGAERRYSEETARRIDAEVRAIVDRNMARARAILERRRDVLEAIAERLLDTETLDQETLRALAGPPARETQSGEKNDGTREREAPEERATA
ncbi:MAG: ATP-dependent zinc metalloprotease FtsH [Deltaproteobacteria bacterium]|nr:MAG: ATP-dependent zinc metalloprotease FtsH [Deltaproteobacteria bacterium]